MAIKRGWEKRRNLRIKKTESVNRTAIEEIKKIKKTRRYLWLMGIMLYWAEGAKENPYKLGQGVSFSNSDYKMIKLFLKWLKICLKIPDNRINIDIYIHENNKHRIEEVRLFWSKVTGFPLEKFGRIYFKKHKINSLRKNRQDNYFGLLRIKVSKSTYINRRITGWIEGVYQKWGVV